MYGTIYQTLSSPLMMRHQELYRIWASVWLHILGIASHIFISASKKAFFFRNFQKITLQNGFIGGRVLLIVERSCQVIKIKKPQFQKI